MFETTTAIPQRNLWLGSLLRAGGLLCLLYVAYWMWMQYATDIQFSRLLGEKADPLAKNRRLARGQFIGKVEVAGNAAVVLEGVDDRTLRVAVGHVPGTALPGEKGRIALAAHRDTFFRSLRSVKIGNRVKLITPNGKYEYQVAKTEIVKPDAMHVLGPTKVNTLTLITCYPFNFIGNAPLRFVVHATKINAGSPVVLRSRAVKRIPDNVARSKRVL